MSWEVLTRDVRRGLQLPDDSIDAVVCDPPYELGFMGKGWDASGVAYSVAVWRDVLRVLKPGGHLLAFGGTRTYHRMACAIEDAGLDVRDSIDWVYATGFPKSLDIGKAIDRAAGMERGIVGVTPEAKQWWQGWGTALKPAHEPIIVARKPLNGTVAANVLAHGTGGLNVDACRVGDNIGRWPPNVVLSHAPECTEAACVEGCPVREMGEQSGVMTSGTAARFFPCFRYEAKASTAEREAGCESLPVGVINTATPPGSPGSNSPRAGAGRTSNGRRNTHPTVKPIALMRWLVRLVTPPGGTVLDPFTGSGSTGVAAVLEGFSFVGFELDDGHAGIARARIANADVQQLLPMFGGEK